jgi:hypothetical protein
MSDRGESEAGLRIRQDPGRSEIFAALSCLTVCLVFAALFGRALLYGEPSPFEDPDEKVFVFTLFALGSLFGAGWTVRAMLTRRRRFRIVRVVGREIVCADGRAVLWREPIATYRQIRWHEERRSHATRYGTRPYTTQVLTLDHPHAERVRKPGANDARAGK